MSGWRIPKRLVALTWRNWLDLVVTLIIVAAAASILGGRSERSSAPKRREIKLPEQALSLAGAGLLGSLNARVGIIEFSDVQCPFCARFANETLTAVSKHYLENNRVVFAFRHFPLIAIHPLAQRGAEIVECGERIGRFKEVHDQLFRRQSNLRSLIDFAEPTTVRKQDFEKCLADGVAQDVESDVALAKNLGITSTPFFLLGSVKDGHLKAQQSLSGAVPFSRFQEVLEELLKQSLRK